MADLKLSDGRELTADMYKLTIGEYRLLLDNEQPVDAGDESLGKVFGLSASEVTALPYPDYRALVTAFYRRSSATNTEKNSESVST
jgi:hypothetical protein